MIDLVSRVSKNYEIIIAYGRRKETLENFKEYFPSDVKFIEVKNFTRNINVKKDFKALLEIRKIVKECKPDLIHLNSSKAGILGRVAVHKKDIKMLYNPHGFSFLKKDDSRLKRFIYKAIEKMTAIINHKCIIVGCSEGEYEEAKKLNKNSICINNGIDTKKLEKEVEELHKKEKNYGKLKICTVGRIDFQKNPKIFNEIAQKFPKNQFTWIGDGKLKNELTSPNIKVTGWLERKDVLKELNNNDIFILPSLWEGLPISLLEAMYMKKICIVSNVIGNREVIKNEKNGYIANTFEDYIRIIESLSQNFCVDDIGENACYDVKMMFDIDRMAKEYQQLYKTLLYNA